MKNEEHSLLYTLFASLQIYYRPHDSGAPRPLLTVFGIHFYQFLRSYFPKIRHLILQKSTSMEKL